MSKISAAYRKTILLFVFIVYSFFLFCNSIEAPYELDDNHTILNNPAVHELNLSNIGHFFTDPRTSSALPENATLRPMTSIAFAVCWKIGGGKTWPFHVYKILLHAFCAMLIFLIMTEIFSQVYQPPNPKSWIAAFLGGLFFLIHPANAETVIYLSATSTLQACFFYLLGFYFFLKDSKRNWILFSVCFLASVFSKEEGVTLPVFCFLYLLIWKREKWREYFFETTYLLGNLAVFAAIYLSLHPKSGLKSMGGVSWQSYFFTQLRAWLHYQSWVFFPRKLTIEHMNFSFSQSFFEPKVILSALFHTTVLSVTAYFVFIQKKFRAYGFYILAFYLAILPASSVLVLSEPINEHRYYIAFAFLLPLAARLILRALHWFTFKFKIDQRGVYFVLLFSVLFFSVLTIKRSMVWANSISLWEEAATLDPSNGRAHNNAGILYMAKGDYTHALSHFNACVQSWAQYKYCYLNQYIANRAIGKMDEASKALEMAYKIDPDSVVVLHYSAHYYFEVKKDPKKAFEILNHCDQVSEKKFAPCLSDRFSFYEAGKNLEGQKSALNDLIPLGSVAKPEAFRFALKMLDEKNYNESEKVFMAFHQVVPSDVQTIYNLAFLDLKQENWKRSKERWLEVLSLDPNVEAAWLNLNLVAGKLGDTSTQMKCKDEIYRIRLLKEKH